MLQTRHVELECQLQILRVSHLTMIRTVGEWGGISNLLKLSEGYRNVRRELDRMEALPRCDVRKMKVEYEHQDDDSTA
jgi:hypothetical protein